ncbi:Argonaute siRNA chaperone complex subunit Arb1-domain-containing protein [Neurospora tetraspora]|uniref:Argonaute siRNA chaperone complex subunit Arb1-domain-containing protein n=1 Tax=Neurospora tetraspora TaxID=94610 RepID=A0AAE0JA68_9PEZI|nr:Argonaute siRNA chaperone complex subunit Arb1-domain-containing protein [Neurospora tetraspora]
MSTHANDSASSGDVPVEVTAARPSSDNDSAAAQVEEDSKPSNDNTSPVDGKENMALTEDAKPKKKKKSKKSKSKKKRPTGFEEYFCDAPMTPAEYEEERKSIYPPNRPFVDRIEECIQRYRARRRFDSAKENLFSRYLFLGGIDTTARQFQGTASLTSHDLDGLDKDDIRDIAANDYVERKPGLHASRYYNPNQPEHWDVDFTGVVAGFLSETLVRLTTPGAADYAAGVDLVSNFLKYVDLHDVCPEYAEDIKNAQRVCQKAHEEMPSLVQILRLLPGNFSSAARLVTCEDDDENAWAREVMDDQTCRRKIGIVMSILMSSKCGHENGIKFEELTGFPTVTKTITQQAYEVVGIVLPNAECHAKFKNINKHLGDANANAIKPCGLLQVKPTVIRNGWENTMHKSVEDVTYNLVMEEEILALMKVGFKFEMDICLLNYGMGFIKKSVDGHPTFYEFLPQELMWGYKEPVANPRPGPSIHNPTGSFEGGDGMGDFLNNDPEDDAPGDAAPGGATPVDTAPVGVAPVGSASVSYAPEDDDVEWAL